MMCPMPPLPATSCRSSDSGEPLLRPPPETWTAVAAMAAALASARICVAVLADSPFDEGFDLPQPVSSIAASSAVVAASIAARVAVARGPAGLNRILDFRRLSLESQPSTSIGVVDARGIHHLGVAVSDLDEAVDSYRRLFGAELEHRETVVDQGVEAASMRIGTGRVELLASLGPTRRSGSSSPNGGRACITSLSRSTTSARS